MRWRSCAPKVSSLGGFTSNSSQPVSSPSSMHSCCRAARRILISTTPWRRTFCPRTKDMRRCQCQQQKRSLVRNVKKRVGFLMGPRAKRHEKLSRDDTCQTFPKLEKRPGAFCSLRSEKRPANRTGFPKGTDQETETFRQVSLYVVVFCWSLPGMSMPLLVSWYVLLGYCALGNGSYACSLVPLFYCHFHGAVVDVQASRITCCRGSSVSFTFVHVVAATPQPSVAAQATLVDLSIPRFFTFTRRTP